MRWWICWRELILTEDTERTRGKYGRERVGGECVASARETPKLVSIRGLTTMGWSCRDYAIRHEGKACKGIVVTAFPVLRYPGAWFNNRASSETFRWRSRWKARKLLFRALRISAYENLNKCSEVDPIAMQNVSSVNTRYNQEREKDNKLSIKNLSSILPHIFVIYLTLNSRTNSYFMFALQRIWNPVNIYLELNWQREMSQICN